MFILKCQYFLRVYSRLFFFNLQEGETKIEYRAWNPFRSKLAASIVGGVGDIHIKPGSKVLYLGAASGTTVSHVSDIVGAVSVACLCFMFLFDVHSQTVATNRMGSLENGLTTGQDGLSGEWVDNRTG